MSAGRALRETVGTGKCFFYVSPYLRTRQTLEGILRDTKSTQILGIREEPRIVEQQFGNFQNLEDVRRAKQDRANFGRFFYRFPNGESGLDVYNRATSFISTVFRDAKMMRSRMGSLEDVNICIVTHGLTLRLILMRWFQYTVDEFEYVTQPSSLSLTRSFTNLDARARTT